MSTTYAEAGVHLSLEDAFSAIAAEVSKASWNNSPFLSVSRSGANFRGPVEYEYRIPFARQRFRDASDGLGTKTHLIDAANAHATAAYDLLAMTATDLARWGALPLQMRNVLVVGSLGANQQSDTFSRLATLLHGLGAAAEAYGVALTSGETAQHKPLLDSAKGAVTVFDWSGTATGLAHPFLDLTGDAIRAGDVVLALREDTLGCNGISLARAAFKRTFPALPKMTERAMAWLRDAAAPCTNYVPFLNEINGWDHAQFAPPIDVHGIVHVTGGGIPLKLGKAFAEPFGLSIHLDNLFDPPPLMCDIAHTMKMESRECYEAFHGGQRLLIIVAEESADECVSIAAAFGLDAKVCGEVQMRGVEPRLTVKSRFGDTQMHTYTSGDW